MGLADFVITSPTAIGRDCRLEVNGEDVTEKWSITRVSFDSGDRQGDVARVFVEVAATVGTISGQGIVEVVRPADVDDTRTAAAFLSNIDPAELERVVLASLDMGRPSTPAMLTQLMRWAAPNDPDLRHPSDS